VIPAKVTGKFSIRSVPNMDVDVTNKAVYDYVEAQFAKLKSKNKLKVWAQHTGNWWVSSPKHWNFSAAAKATERVWGVEPDFTREGGRYVFSFSFFFSSFFFFLFLYSFSFAFLFSFLLLYISFSSPSFLKQN
jgi:Cys-Gly metallodipeptidase DUG1